MSACRLCDFGCDCFNGRPKGFDCQHVTDYYQVDDFDVCCHCIAHVRESKVNVDMKLQASKNPQAFIQKREVGALMVADRSCRVCAASRAIRWVLVSGAGRHGLHYMCKTCQEEYIRKRSTFEK